MDENMKRLKGTVIFIICFLIILALDFTWYKNINRFLPTNEKELYSFPNDEKDDRNDFLSEMYEIVIMKNSYKQNIEFEEIRNNNILYNLIRNINDEDNDIEELNSYISDLSNTIYGNLKALNINVNGMDYLIIYSEDMKKLYYLNVGEALANYESTYNILDEQADYYGIDQIQEEYNEEVILTESNENENTKVEKNIEKLRNNVKIAFSNMVKTYEFEPDTIIYRGNYYILKDSTRDVTIYYNDISDVIFGFYIGFNK